VRIAHKLNPGWHPSSDPVDEAYQRQVDRATDRREREYAAAEKRRAAAQRRLKRAERHLAAVVAAPKVRRQEKRAAVAAVEARRLELADLLREMTATAAGTEHRGTASYRPVPQPKVI
jgi:hypothetical protein